MVELTLLAKKCCKSLCVLFIFSTAFAFESGDAIRATDINNYFIELKESFDSSKNNTLEFYDSIDLSKKKIKDIYEFTSTKNSSTTNAILFEENLPEGSFLCSLSTSPSSQFPHLFLSFYVGTVADPINDVSYPITPSATNLNGKTFNLTHMSSVSSNFKILFNTNQVFTDLEFVLKCRKML